MEVYENAGAVVSYKKKPKTRTKRIKAFNPFKNLATDTRRLLTKLAVSLAVFAALYIVRITGDMSYRLSLLLMGAVLAAAAYQVGVWKQIVHPEEGDHHED